MCKQGIIESGRNVRCDGVNLLTYEVNWNRYRLSESGADKLAASGQNVISATPRHYGSVSITFWSVCVFLFLAQASFLFAQSRRPDQTSTAYSIDEIKSTIEALGDNDFLVRQRSSETLLGIGADAIPHLKKAQAYVDHEVRHRASDILKKLLETDLKERTNRFLLLPPASNDDCGFEHWRTFSRLAGTSREARSLLAEIYSNPQSEKLLASIDLATVPSGNAFEAGKTGSFNDQSVTTSLTAYAAEMYRRSMRPLAAGGNLSSSLSGNGVLEELTASAFESNFLSLSPITVQQSKHEQAFLELLNAWLRFELQSTPLTIAKLKIISAYRLRSFADYLSQVIAQPEYPHKQAALEALFRVSSPTAEDEQSLSEGDSGAHDAISHLKPFVLSNEVLVRLPQAETIGAVDVTIGDIAFQLILNLQGKAPKDFGMSEANGRMILDNTSVFCFRTPEARSQPIEQWLNKHDESGPNADE